eukprot:3671454-Pleurochrysis_carterae.AAC.2
MCTAFNGASRIVQSGALACLDDEARRTATMSPECDRVSRIALSMAKNLAGSLRSFYVARLIDPLLFARRTDCIASVYMSSSLPFHSGAYFLDANR